MQSFGDPRDDGFDLIEMHPKIAELKAPEHVPDDVAQDFIEALDGLRRENWTSAGLMLRKVLQRSTTMLAPGDARFAHMTLMARVDELAERHLITPAMREWAHIIRLDGNEAAHREDEAFTRCAVTQMKDFTELFLIYAFTLPERVHLYRNQSSHES